jgi:hypothetical protein
MRLSMTRAQFLQASRRVNIYGGVGAWFGLAAVGAVIMPVALLARPSLELLGNQFPDEGFRGLAGGLIISAFLDPLLIFGALTPLFWVDGMFGLRCPVCGRSITLLKPNRVLESGRCRNCNALLFEPPQPDS